MFGLSLFSGIGGIDLALSDWVVPIAYCEIDRYCQGVLLSRMSEGELPIAPIWDDVTTLRAEHLPIKPDIIYGGFPCQPYSTAASGRNVKDTLLCQYVRIVAEFKPRFFFAENVTKRAIIEAGKRFSAIGYHCNATNSFASELGAPFSGERYWLLGAANDEGESVMPFNEKMALLPPYAESLWSKVDPRNIRMDDGVSNRVDRLKCLGNAVVPLQAKVAFERLMSLR